MGAQRCSPPSTECPPPQLYSQAPFCQVSREEKQERKGKKKRRGGGKKIASKQMIAPPPRVPRGGGGFTAGGVGRATEGAALGGGGFLCRISLFTPVFLVFIPYFIGGGGGRKGGQGLFCCFLAVLSLFPPSNDSAEWGGDPKGQQLSVLVGRRKGGTEGVKETSGINSKTAEVLGGEGGDLENSIDGSKEREIGTGSGGEPGAKIPNSWKKQGM